METTTTPSPEGVFVPRNLGDFVDVEIAKEKRSLDVWQDNLRWWDSGGKRTREVWPTREEIVGRIEFTQREIEEREKAKAAWSSGDKEPARKLLQEEIAGLNYAINFNLMNGKEIGAHLAKMYIAQLNDLKPLLKE